MVTSMSTEQKKAFLLLNFVIFCYHGLDQDEIEILQKTASKLDATEELKWVEEFVNTDPVNSFERSREYFATTIATYDTSVKLDYLNTVWEATNLKGYISEMEAMAMLKLAKDWGVQKELLSIIRK